MSKPPSLQLFSVVVDSSPPSSPTKFSDAMKWLTRTPAGVPLPSSSPTKARKLSTADDDGHDTAFLNPASPDLSESNITKAMRSLRSKPSLLSLYSRPSASASSVGSPLASPQKEATRWLFRSPTAQGDVCTPSPSELGDHFARAIVPVESKSAEMRRRREASRMRVAALRDWLGSSTIITTDTPALYSSSPHTSPLLLQAEPPFHASKAHHRIDSAMHPFPFPFSTSPVSLHLSHATPPEDLLLQTTLFRLPCRPSTHFPCIGCGQTHADSPRDRSGGAVWMLMRCRHLVHGGCLHRLSEGEDAVGERTEDVQMKGEEKAGCVGCTRLRGLLGGMEREEVEARVRRLVGGGI